MSLPFVDELIQEFGSPRQFHELFMVGDAIAATQSRDLTDAERHAVEADFAALTFHGGPCTKSCWGTHFAPRSSDKQMDGSIVHSPDITQLTADSVQQWKQRATNATDPVLKSRYADVVWDLEQTIIGSGARSYAYGQMAFDSYIQAVADRRVGSPILSTFPLHRALAIASELNDRDRIEKAATSILELGASAPQVLFPGYVFCRLQLPTNPKLFDVPGVIRMLGPPRNPTPIQDEEIEHLKLLMEAMVPVEFCARQNQSSSLSARLRDEPREGISRAAPQTDQEPRKLTISFPTLKCSITIILASE